MVDDKKPEEDLPEPHSEDGDATSHEDLIEAEGPDQETPVELSEEDLAVLDEAEQDLLAEMRDDLLRVQAELVNFRTRVERDRLANRESVIAEVIRSLLPVIDDLDRAEAHGDLEEGSALALIAQKLRAAFEKYGLHRVGAKGEPFDPHLHEAIVQVPTPGVGGEHGRRRHRDRVRPR